MLKTLFFESTLKSTIIYVILSCHQFTNISDHLCSLIHNDEIRRLIKNNRFSFYELDSSNSSTIVIYKSIRISRDTYER